jgi:hypothetical protein
MEKWYIYKIGCYPTMKNNKILSFKATWMELEVIILGEIN